MHTNASVRQTTLHTEREKKNNPMMRHRIMLSLLYAVKLSTALRVFVSRDGPGPRIPSRWQNPVWIRVADKITNTHHVCEYIYRLPSSSVESTGVEVAGKNSFLMFCKDVAQVTNACILRWIR